MKSSQGNNCQKDIGQRLLEGARAMDSEAITLCILDCNDGKKWQAAFGKLMECGVRLDSAFLLLIERVKFEKCVKLFADDLRFDIPYGAILRSHGRWDHCSFSLNALSKHFSYERIHSWWRNCGTDAIRHMVIYRRGEQLDRIIEQEVTDHTFGNIMATIIWNCLEHTHCFEKGLSKRFDKMLAAAQGRGVDVVSIFLRAILDEIGWRRNGCRIHAVLFRKVFSPLVRAFILCHRSHHKSVQNVELRRAQEVVRANILPVEEVQSVFLPFLMPTSSGAQLRLIKKIALEIHAINIEIRSIANQYYEVARAGNWRRQCVDCLRMLRELKRHLKRRRKFKPSSIDPAKLVTEPVTRMRGASARRPGRG